MSKDDLRTCTKCGKAKPPTAYHRNSAQKDGLAAHCVECERLRRKAWYAKHKVQNLAYQAEWRKANRALKAESDRLWRERNAERKRTNDAAYREANRERISALKDAWRKANPERMTEMRRRRRARKHAAFVALVKFDVVLVRDLGTCGICGTSIMETTIELDHIVPLAAGGTHEPDNVQLAHRTCNRRKSAKTDYVPAAA